jgi:hypothetical protein
MGKRRAVIVLGLVATWACGGEVRVLSGQPSDAGGDGGGGAIGGGGTGGGGVGGSTTTPVPSAIEGRAPTQYSFEVRFQEEPPPEALEASSYTATGKFGPVAIESASYDPASRTLTLGTGKQKLGVEYTLTLSAAGAWNGLAATFYSADTARFWAHDLASGGFDQYQLTAARKDVGEHVVVYVAEGQSVNNAAVTVSFFDEKIYPIETELFHPAPDRDENGKIVLLGLDGKGAYGGYFSSLNAMSDAEALALWGLHSNETEMVYINVEGGSFDNEHVVAHEFAHLLYHEEPAHHGNYYYAWHNEGLAECAVHAVNGDHPIAPWYYSYDPTGAIAAGTSLVHWEFGNYDQYVLSYLFLTYLASQTGGTAAYGTLFDLNGAPEAIDAHIQSELGIGFAEAHARSLVATWAQDVTGPYSYQGMVAFFGPPPAGSGPVDLPPFAGAFRKPTSSPLLYPGNQGPDVIYFGINGLGAVASTEPFDTTGGALLIFNTSQEVFDPTPQPSGTVLTPLLAMADTAGVTLARSLVRRHPPPLDPRRLEVVRRWQRAAGLRQ